MKPGLTISELAAEILLQKDRKEDYIVNTPNLRMEAFGTDMLLRVLDDSGQDRIEPLDIGPNAHRQIGTYLSIPAKYYAKMQEENPELLSANVNSWFERTAKQRMLRVLDGHARAFLSNRYKRLDHYQIAEAVLPVIGQMPDVRFESCQITEDRMYIKAVNPRLQTEVTPGDIVQAGLIISNSEVGLGSVSIQPLIYRLVCSNGMVVNDAATKRNHIGRTNSADENFQLYSAETLEADDHADMRVEYIPASPATMVSESEYFEALYQVPAGRVTRFEDIMAYLCRKHRAKRVELIHDRVIGYDEQISIPIWREVSARGFLQEHSWCSRERQAEKLKADGLTVVPCGSYRKSLKVDNYQEYLFDFNLLDVIENRSGKKK